MVIVPRAVTNRLRISRVLFRSLWRLWPLAAYRFHSDDDKREDFLATFAPFVLVTLMQTWVVMLIVGYGLLFFAVRGGLWPPGETFGDALYYSGTSLFTLGYGDITAHTWVARALSLAAAASGLGVLAVVVSFLFSLFAAFQRRETFVVGVGARAGTPASGVGLLAMHARLGIRSDLPLVFLEGQKWTAEVLESHMAYPPLMYFRSSHDYESWVGTLGTLLDAAVLLLSATKDANTGQARIMYEIGRHLTRDFAHYYNVQGGPDVGIERPEFDAARARLIENGYEMAEADGAWSAFCELRSAYAGNLNAMARLLEIPPLAWIGDRSIIGAAQARAHNP